MKSKAVFATLGFFVVLALLAAPVAVSQPGQASDPVDLSFEKFQTTATRWVGTVWGDVSGGVIVDLTGLQVTGPIWHVLFHWDVDAGAYSFEADVMGVINTMTGRVVLNGVVVSGWLTGAQLHIEAQLFEDMHSEGTIRIMPSS